MTFDFQIERPVQISMNIIETVDERLPSFRMDTKCKIPHPTGFVLYQANDIWFEGEAWDLFEKQIGLLLRSSANSATLANISENFILSIIADGKNTYSFQLKCHEPETGMGMIQLSYQTKIDADIIGSIERALLSFPAWW